jgi:ElaB/YqjD/DUF883 family membrane-anchored ribosome-binding protein
MFKRKSRTERVADEAWDNLVSAIESAGDAARSVGRRTAGLASDFADEAQSRFKDGASSAKDRASSVRDAAKDRAGSVRDSAKDRASTAKDRAGGIKDEAWNRAGNALDALAGRRPRRSWGWIGVALLGGIAVGWAVAASAPKAISAAKQLAVGEDDLAPEVAPVVTPTPASGDEAPTV